MTARLIRVALVPAALLAALALGCSSGGEPATGVADDAAPSRAATAVPSDPSPVATQTPAPVVGLPPVLATVVVAPPPPADTAGEPPAGSASAGGASVALGLGSYCWTSPAGPGLCADSVGVVTAPGSLTVAAGGSVRLGGPLLAAAVDMSSATAWARPDAPIASGGDWAAWAPWGGSSGAVGATLALDLEGGALSAPAAPGRYLVSLSVSFPQGDALYGLLIEVGQPAAGDAGARGPVFVESVELLVLESFPIQLWLEVDGHLPTPCSEPRWEAHDDGVTIAVTLWSTSDPATACIQVLEPLELSIPLGPLATGRRTVTVNGEVVGTASAGG